MELSEKKLKTRDYVVIASLLFGLFFGAGNLIFPLHLGQLAGAIGSRQCSDFWSPPLHYHYLAFWPSPQRMLKVFMILAVHLAASLP